MIIFEASTLILIARIELLDPFLAVLSMRATVPIAVHRECCGAKKTLDGLMIQRMVDDSRLEVAKVRDRTIVAKMREDFSLGAGEAEVISLALQSNARLVGIDDKNGISACKLLHLPFTTAAGILLICRERNVIGKREAAGKLDLLAKYGRYKNTIVEDVRARLEEYP